MAREKYNPRPSKNYECQDSRSSRRESNPDPATYVAQVETTLLNM